jgi:hypothetical protein
MIGPLHITKGVSDMLTFSINILGTDASRTRWRGNGVITIVDDVNDMQWHLQGTGEFTRENQCGPAGRVTV